MGLRFYLLEVFSLGVQEIGLWQEVILLRMLLLLLVYIPVEGFLSSSLPAPWKVVYLLELVEVF